MASSVQRTIWYCSILIFILLYILCTSVYGQTEDQINEWRQLDSLIERGLPESAINMLEHRYKEAKKSNNPAKLIKTFLLKLRLHDIYDKYQLMDNMKLLEIELDASKEPVKSIYYSILAEMYWGYYKSNRRTILKIQADDIDMERIDRWDAKSFIRKVNELYNLSITNRDLLKTIPIERIEPILSQNKEMRKFRPTLYDFLAYRALGFYKNEERYLSKFHKREQLQDKRLFGTVNDYLNLNLNFRMFDLSSARLDALELLQSLLKIHKKSPNPFALFEADINRLRLVYQYSLHPQKDILYERALSGLLANYHDTMIIGRIKWSLASFYFNQNRRRSGNLQENRIGSLSEAHRLLTQILSSKVDSLTQINAQDLKDHIEKAFYQITVENVNLPGKPFRALIKYKNVSDIYLRILNVRPEEIQHIKMNPDLTKKNSLLDCYYKSHIIKKYFSVTLPKDNDYREHSTEIEMPLLSYGHYVILISDTESFESFAHTTTWISNFAFLQMKQKKNIIYVLNRHSGFPIEDAQVSKVRYERDVNKYITIENDRTGKDGKVEFAFGERRYQCDILEFKKGRDRFITGNSFHNYQYKEESRIHTYIFTDRAIYRPGQKVYFKGLVIEQFNKSSEIVSGLDCLIKLIDNNSQIIQVMEVESNDYGTFSGSFNLSENIINGSFSIKCYKGKSSIGSARLKVEEYKRPQFEFKFEPLTKVYRPGDTVTVIGKVFAYAGFPLYDACVHYTIERRPDFAGDYKSSGNLHRFYINEFVEDSTIHTDKSGNFYIKFKSGRDSLDIYRNLLRDRYIIKANITDVTGESHTKKTSIIISDIALQLDIEALEKMNREKSQTIHLKTLNQNGEKIPAKGSIKIFKLEDPEKIYRERLWDTPDRYVMTKAVYDSLFPNDYYADENDITKRKRVEQFLETPFDTKSSTEIVLDEMDKWPEGDYVLECTSVDTFNNMINSQKYFELFSSAKYSIPSKRAFWYYPLNTYCSPGDTASILCGTAASRMYGFWQVVHNLNIIEEQIITEGKTKHILKIPIKEKYRGNIGYSFIFLKYGRVHHKFLQIQVPWDNKLLNTEFISFRSDLTPGQEEEWRIRFKGYKGNRVAAEFLGALYDASLDFYSPNSWNVDLFRNYSHRGFWINDQNQVSKINQSKDIIRSRYYYKAGVGGHIFDQLYLFGFNTIRGEWDYHYPIMETAKTVKPLKNTAKGRRIEGIVTDNETGEPLPGANILTLNHKIGAASDLYGKFILNIPDDYPYKKISILVVYIGYKAIQINVVENSYVEIGLNSTSIEGEAIVVTASAARISKNILAMQTGIVMSDKISIRGLGNANVAKVITPLPGVVSDKIQETQVTSFTKFPMRKYFSETAFFFPHLKTNKDGDVIFSFTMPDAITKWNFLGLAHTKNLEFAQLKGEVITIKPFMVISNPPRFTREGDTLVYSGKLVNISKSDQECVVNLETLDAANMHSIDIIEPDSAKLKKCIVGAGETLPLQWRVTIPADLQGITFRIMAKSGLFSDGEERTLPVLPNRHFLQESIPFTIKGGEQKKYRLDNLIESEKSKTLDHHQLILEMTTNPVWTALRSLPYLMEYPYECSEQLFNRFYANIVAAHILRQNPKIENVFNSWIQKDQLKSNLEKNNDLINILLQETPWIRDAQDETKQMQLLVNYFDYKKLRNDQSDILDKLIKIFENHGWPWFKGGKVNPYITNYILAGFGRLKARNIFSLKEGYLVSKIKDAINHLDYTALQRYTHIMETANIRHKPYIASSSDIHYLYTRSFYTDIESRNNIEPIIATWLDSVHVNFEKKSLQLQAMLALALHRFDKEKQANQIIESLLKKAIHSEAGIHWEKNRSGYFWYEAPIETHAMIIEAMSEITNDRKIIDEMRLWLLRQKRTQSWSTTKATADAIYALICTGSEWINIEPEVTISLGSKEVKSNEVDGINKEAGTGYFKKIWNKDEIKPDMGKIVVEAENTPLAWGGLYWQYFENFDQMNEFSTADIKINKTLYLKKSVEGIEKIVMITDDSVLQPGDQVLVRLKCDVTRNLEFIHIKDHRAATFEPVSLLSGYRYKNRLRYYESIKDASINIFIDNLPVGKHEIEYSLWVTHAGSYENGIATIQCMYAPEFSSHTKGMKIRVDKK